MDRTYGVMNFYVHDKDLFQFKYEGKTYMYEYPLIYLISWLVNHWKYILGYDPYPLLPEAKDFQQINSMKETVFSEDRIERELQIAADADWIQRHAWMVCRKDTMLSDISIRRRERQIEIQWNNEAYEKRNIFFVHPRGDEFIEYETFRMVLLDFLNDIVDEFEKNIGADTETMELYQKVGDLKHRLAIH